MKKQNIRYLQRHDIDVLRWNDCISHAVNGNIYAFSWYLDEVCPGWSALVRGDYEQVFPLTARKKFGIHYLYQPFFTQQLGLFSQVHLTENDVSEFLEAIPAKYRLIEINLNAYNKVTGKDFNIRQNLNLELDLIPDYDTLRKSYNDNLKRKLRKAESAGITIRPLPSIKELIVLFRENKGKEVSTFKERDYQTLVSLVLQGERHKAFESAAAFLPDGSLCAGAVFAFSNHKAIFLFSGSDDRAKATGAMSLLIDNFIRHHCEQHLTLDFEGSNDPDLARFYRSFGSAETAYPQLHRNTLPAYINYSHAIFKWLKEKLSKNS